MSVLELDVVVPDTPEELYALIGDPAAEHPEPFRFVLVRLGWFAPVGIYRVPTKPWEVIRSQWPAEFVASEKVTVDGGWELWTAKGKLVRSGPCFTVVTLWPGDRLAVDVTLRGVAGRV